MSEYFLEKDFIGQPEAPVIILANKNGTIIGTLNIEEPSLVIKVLFEDSEILLSELSCDMHKYINTIKNPLWDQVKNFKTIFVPLNVPHIKARGLWYEIEVTIDDNDETVKHITGTLAQHAELSQTMNFNVEIRTEADMERDDYVDTIFYNPNNPQASIVHRVLNDKASHYSIYHVDDSLKNVKRTFSFNGSTIVDNLKEIAEEVDCLIVFGESNDRDFTLHRTISFYDKKDYCPACGKRGDFSNGCTNPECAHNQTIIPRYGRDTGIFINHENLGEDISLSVNVDNIKNCYRLEAGDDDMTATIRNCNPSGSQYLWKFTDDMKNDMSSGLRTRINQYESAYNNYRYSYAMSGVTSTNISNYNTLVNKYQSYSSETLNAIDDPIIGYPNLTAAYYYSTYLKGFLENVMMPASPDVVDTTAQQELNKFNLTKIGVRTLAGMSKSSAGEEVKEAARLYINESLYSISVVSTSYSNKTWNGTITVTSYTDDEDTATASKSITFTEATGDYLKNQIEKYIKKKETNIASITDLLELSEADYILELKKYNLNSLTNISAVLSAVLGILDDAGITAQSNPDVYEALYEPYSIKKTRTQQEISTRDGEIAQLDAIIQQINTQMQDVNSALSLKTYLGDTLWLELLSFRREEELSDSNCISTGLSDLELIQNAQDFFDKADEDIAKKAEAEFSVSCTLKNLLVLLPDVYDKLLYLFDVGNWLRIEVDEKIYKLQLISYEINFGDLTHIQVEFSDAKKSNDFISKYTKTTKSLKDGLTTVSREAAMGIVAANIINQLVVAQDDEEESSVMIPASAVLFDNNQNLEDYLPTLIKESDDALAITLSNEFQIVTTDENGDNGDYSDCSTDVRLNYGLNDITDYENVTWSVTIPQTVTGTWDSTNYQVAVTGLSEDYGVIEIQATYKNTTVRKNFVIKKVKISQTGESAVSYKLSTSNTIIAKYKSGAYHVNSITFLATSKTGTQNPAAYSGRFVIETTNNDSTWTTVYTSSSNESSKTYSLSSGLSAVRCSLYQSGGTTVLLDIVTVPIINDGEGYNTVYYGTTSDTFSDVAPNDYLIDDTDGSTYRYYNGDWVKVTDYQTPITEETNERKAKYGVQTATTDDKTEQIKLITCSNYELVAGNEITIYFQYANVYASGILKLNINGKGEKAVWVANEITSSTNKLLWGAGAYITFKYDGSQFVVIGEPRTWYGSCTTISGTNDKTTTVTGCVICKGTKVSLAMQYENTGVSPTLNVSSTGALAIYAGTVRPLASNGLSWANNTTQEFIFDGTTWRTGDSGAATKAKEMSDDAAKTATNYIADVDSMGIMVHPNGDSTSGWRISDAIELFKSGVSYIRMYIENSIAKIRVGREDQGHIILDNDSIDIYNDEDNIASFGETARIGKSDSSHVTLSSEGFSIYNSGGYSTSEFITNNIHNGYAYGRVFFYGDGNTTTFWNIYNVVLIRGCYYEDTSEDINYPIIDQTDPKKLTFDVPPDAGRTVAVEYATDENLYKATIGTRLSSGHSDYTGSGTRSIAIGNANSVYGAESICIGSRNMTYSNYNFGLGSQLKVGTQGTASVQDTQVAVGKYNEQKDHHEVVFLVGSGTSNANRKNALEITVDDDLLLYLDINASINTTDGQLYSALSDLQIENDVII